MEDKKGTSSHGRKIKINSFLVNTFIHPNNLSQIHPSVDTAENANFVGASRKPQQQPLQERPQLLTPLELLPAPSSRHSLSSNPPESSRSIRAIYEFFNRPTVFIRFLIFQVSSPLPLNGEIREAEPSGRRKLWQSI